jgi:transcriptional regulator
MLAPTPKELLPEQEEELMKRRDEILLKLRMEGRTQEEVARLLGIKILRRPAKIKSKRKIP